MSDISTPGGAPAPPVPVCPRHPDRESYVRCQRCERPACPECQRPAAVGIQCVDCVREQNKGTRAARTVFGGAVGGGTRSARPVVTISIIAACVVVYLLQISNSRVTEDLSYYPVLTRSEPWRMLTSAFLHSPQLALHILFNMYALWMIGPYLEGLFGRARYLALYLLCAFGGSVGYLLLWSGSDQDLFASAVGASGAVFGLFGAFVVVQRRLQRDAGGMYAVIAINFAIGFVPGFNIAWQAHLGGLVTGVVAAAALAYAPRDRRTLLQAGGLAAVLLVLLALTAVKVGTSTQATLSASSPQGVEKSGESSTGVIPQL